MERFELDNVASARPLGMAVSTTKRHGQECVNIRYDILSTKGTADANFSILRRTALMLLENEKTTQLGATNKQPSAGRNDEPVRHVLVGS
jgi:hypothetical protein